MVNKRQHAVNIIAIKKYTEYYPPNTTSSNKIFLGLEYMNNEYPSLCFWIILAIRYPILDPLLVLE